MKVRLALFGIALVALSATAASAQNPAGPGGMGNRRMQMMMTGITLTPQQQAWVDSVTTAFTALRAQLPAFNRDAPPDSAAMAQRRALSARQDSTVRTILTPEQQATWDANAERARSMQRRPPGE